MTERPANALATAREASQPQRTCVGCRRPGERSVLLRFVAARVDGANAVVLDPRRASPGRGAWLHPDLGCLDLARRRSAFSRALRTAGPLDLAGMIEQVQALVSPVPAQEDAAPHAAGQCAVHVAQRRAPHDAASQREQHDTA